MDPFIGAALIGAAGQMFANEQTAASAQRQMGFQERMSSTAYQRAMQDMREAGLNPILAAKVGGASSPAGAMSQFGNVGAAATQAYQQASAAEASRGSEQLSLAQANLADKTAEKIVVETNNARNQAEVIVQTGLNLKEMVKRTGQETRTGEQQESVLKKQILLIAEQIKDTKAAAALKEADVNFIKKLENEFGAGGSQVTNILNLLIRALNR